jgi:hypothetical protein
MSSRMWQRSHVKARHSASASETALREEKDELAANSRTCLPNATVIEHASVTPSSVVTVALLGKYAEVATRRRPVR